ncbi:universal stress protein [Streptomyces sp. CBMA152]|uniref:universal stress protein n=1 Tax=Streptomyces sp. CBMA152 TaxID=1896312 RepID=UPI0016600AC5
MVGVDGSEASTAAQHWAAQQARALHAEVVAVPAWEPVGPLHAPYAPASARPTAAEQRFQAAQLLISTLRAVFGPQTDGAVRAALAEGPPVRSTRWADERRRCGRCWAMSGGCSARFAWSGAPVGLPESISDTNSSPHVGCGRDGVR